MSNNQVKSLTINGITYDLVDETSGYITSYTETDPTVPSWAKASSKPSYTASEVGAAASSHTHGNITNGGDITATAPTIANGDQLIINDDSASKITNGPTFDGSTTSKYLSPKGTWENLPQGTAYSAGTGLSLSGTTFNHSNSVTAQATQAVYPIKIDAQGHISDYGSAVTIPSDTKNTAGSTNSTSKLYLIGSTAQGDNPQTYSNTNLTVTNGAITANGDLTLGVKNNNQSKLIFKYDDSTYGTLHASGSSGTVTTLLFGNATNTGTTTGNVQLRGVANPGTDYDVANKRYVDSLVSGVMHYKGTKSTVANLPTSGNTTGDVWHITADGSEWAWDGSTWQELGTAVDLSSYALKSEVPGSAATAVTGISIADHTTSSITGVQSSTTSVTGVQSTTTTASKATAGTAISIPNVTSAGSASNWVFEDVTVPIKNAAATSIPNVTAVGSGSYTQGNFTGGSFTQGEDTFTPNTPTVIDITKFSGGSYSHSGFSGGSFTRGSFSGGSLTMTMDSTDTKKLNITFTAATHGNDSFTAATYGTDSFTAAKINSGFYTAGTAASFTQGEDEFTPATHGTDSHTHTPPTLGTAISITGVQSTTTTASHVKSGGNGTAPTLGTAISITPYTFSDVTVPIKDASATTVPIKNASATTVVTGKTHSITDNGHSHSLN